VLVAGVAGFLGMVLVMAFLALLHLYRMNDGPLPYLGFAVGAVVGWIGVGRVLAKRGSTAAPKDGPPLTVEERGEWTYVYARPGRLPLRVNVVAWVFALVPAAALGYAAVSGMSHPPIPLFLLVTAVGLPILAALFTKGFEAFHGLRRGVQRQGFEVSPTGIRLADGRVVPQASIARVTIRNTLDDRVVAVGGFNVAGGVTQMGVQTQRLISAVSFVVNVEHDGRSTTLSGGLDETLAHAVMREITRRLPGFAM
jgi:hypothetical protein